MINVKITAANVTTPAMRKLKLVKNGSIMFIKERFFVSVVSCTSVHCMGLGLRSLREHQVFSAQVSGGTRNLSRKNRMLSHFWLWSVTQRTRKAVPSNDAQGTWGPFLESPGNLTGPESYF